MEIKQFTMLAVGLIVGVLLITGVIAPVIANVTGDSGNVQPTNVSYDDYTNTGDVYLMEPDGVQHNITITYADSKMTFAYDGTDFLEKSLGTEDWEVPIVEYKVRNSPYYPQYRVASLVYSSSFENLTFDGYNFAPEEISGANGLCMSITTNYNGYMDGVFISGYWTDPAQTFSFTTTKFIAQDGEYVYSKTPTVYAESLVSVFSSLYTDDATISGMSGELYVDVGGWAKLSKWQGAIDETFPHAYAMGDFETGSKETGSKSYLSESFTVAVHTHASGSAYVLDDFTFNITMDDGNGGEIEYVYAVDTFIVPVIAKYIPDNGFWKMADDSETDIYTDYLGNNLYGVFSENPSNGGQPFILEEIGNETSMLPILIGESFIAYIQWEPGTYDWDAQINFYGLGYQGDSYAYASTNHVHIEGDTISFTNWDNEEYSSDGLLAYISPDGEYTSFTEPTSAELSYIGFVGDYSLSDRNYAAGDMADVDIGMVGVMSGTDLSYISGMLRGYISVDGGEDNWDEVEYALTTSNTSCKINKSNGMFTGLTISTQGKSFSMPIGYSSDETITDDLYERLGGGVFVVGLIGSNSGGGGSGSAVSPTLSTLLSVIPLLMIVGLVIGTIAFFKMRS